MATSPCMTRTTGATSAVGDALCVSHLTYASHSTFLRRRCKVPDCFRQPGRSWEEGLRIHLL